VPEAWNNNEMRAKGILTNCCDAGGAVESALEKAVAKQFAGYNWESLGTGCIAPYWEVNGRFSVESCAEECQKAKPTMCTLFSFEHHSGRCFLTQGGSIGSGCSDETVYKLVKREYIDNDDRRCGCPSGWKKYDRRFCRMMDPTAPWKSKYYCNLGMGVPEAWNNNEMRAKGILTNCCDAGGAAEATVGETIAVAENVAPGPSNVVSAFALVGFIATIYGAGRHYLKK